MGTQNDFRRYLRMRGKGFQQSLKVFLSITLLLILSTGIALAQNSAFLKGKVIDTFGDPIPGVHIITSDGVENITSENQLKTVTDFDGNFILKIPEGRKIKTVTFSFVGMETVTLPFKGKPMNVTMKEDTQAIEEVVVNGYYTKDKSSFTGTVVSVNKDDLKKISSTNIMTALQVFDPSFKLQDDIAAGSNPNALPKMRIRGDSGFGEISETSFKNDPNQPTFILDGYEVSAEKVYDLNMERVENVTILKDASATAIYGSRAANGVIVITTKVPEPGKLRVSYQFNGSLQTPDLTDYNLMNASEKLQAEKLAGLYETDDIFNGQQLLQDYSLRYRNVMRGIDTYWLSQPLKTAFGQRHNLYVEGGDKNIRYSVSASYHNNPGVMKESGRDRYGLDFNLQYNKKNKLLFRNTISVGYVKSKESPYGSFSTYTQTNPYWPIYDDKGEMIKLYPQYLTAMYQHWNPLVEAQLNNQNKSEYMEVNDNFSFEWNINSNWRLKGQLSYTMRNDHAYRFTDPASAQYNGYDFQDGEGVLKKGAAYNADKRSYNLDFNALVTYNQIFGKHYLNGAIGVNTTESKNEDINFSVQGFPSGNMDYISFAKEFSTSSPGGTEGLSRLFGSFLNFNYSYNNIYLLDISGRLDGSSTFGKDSHFAPFWSTGIGWNIHNERFYTGIKDVMNHLKVTMNIGETGKTSFSPYEAQNMFNYYKGKYYDGGMGAIITTYGNNNLKWEKTRSWDINLETGFLNDRISAKFTYYNKLTNNLLADVTLPQSSGFLSYRENIGKMENTGYELNLRGFVLQNKDWNVSVFGTLAHNKNIIKEISNSLKAKSEKIDKDQDAYNPEYFDASPRPQVQFKEGESTTTIYAVRSLGINPANGREVFLDRYNNPTYEWSASDKEACGDTAPTVQGSFGLNADWKGFNVNASFLYEFGGQLYNQTLVDRVENARLQYNADRRVLYDRWQKPGDIAKYKDIKDKTRTNLTSRMIQDNDMLNFKSLSMSYTFPSKLTKKFAMERVKLTFQVEDLFYWSTVKRERGLDYPYSHTYNFGLQVQF